MHCVCVCVCVCACAQNADCLNIHPGCTQNNHKSLNDKHEFDVELYVSHPEVLVKQYMD